MSLVSILSATAATGLFLIFKFKIFIKFMLVTVFPFHLRGLNGLIGVIAILFEFKERIGPLTDKL